MLNYTTKKRNNMTEPGSRERSYLTKLSHSVEPIIRIGKNGLTENILIAIDELLTSKELIKIKFIDFKDERQFIAQEIAQKTDSFLVRV
ncbi:MAG: YhbY family RNA-binding protein, partial [Spirochaetaceae bacterium]|nr:YhbY family RNA-binding protein [Spirochaetaceae bacterium]